MEIQVKQIKPNPYRDMSKYPIDRIKVEALKNSINQTGFWDNVLARKHKDEIQLAYGHHRLIALQELGIKKINIPVKDIPEAAMVQIMINENSTEYNISTAIINESVKVAKEYLDGELAKYDSWERLNKSIKSLFTSPESFTKTKQTGVGQTTLLKFMGENWKQWQIGEGLSNLKKHDIDIRATETFDTISDAQEFKKVVRAVQKESKKEIPAEKQIQIASKIKEKFDKKDLPKGGRVKREAMNTMVRQEVDEKDEYDVQLADVQLRIKTIDNTTKELSNRIGELNGKLDEMGVDSIKSLNNLTSFDNFLDLHRNMKTLLKYLGFDLNNK